MKSLTITSPLFTGWTGQYVRLYLADIQPGAALQLIMNGESVPFQYTGNSSEKGAEILVKLRFEKGESKEIAVRSRPLTPPLQPTGQSEISAQSLIPVEIPLRGGTVIGAPGGELTIPDPEKDHPHPSPLRSSDGTRIQGPFAAFGRWPTVGTIRCETAFEGARLFLTNDGPLFTDYELTYRFAENRRYTLNFRCYKKDNYVEVCETFSLGMSAELVWTLNPQKQFTHIISRDSFEGDSQPTIEPLGAEHPRDVLCRLQMPVLSEYFIPNNRGWFGLFDQRNESRGMLGILGLYGAKWEEPVANMPEVLDKGGTVEWHASLVSGKRYWLLYGGPVEKGYQKPEVGIQNPKSGRDGLHQDGRFVFHRLHAEFNALRLDEHLDLSGERAFDESRKQASGVFAAGDYHAAAQQRFKEYPCLQDVLSTPDPWLNKNGGMHLANYRYLLEPTQANAEAVYGHLIARFEKWVRQFQGYRTDENDYMKNVIGFSRYLRGMLLGYEMLRRDGVLCEEQVNRLNSYFIFAARRITDEGRWPHSRTTLHPDHPESSRDFYTYGGEHKPDRLYWTNCLPNFQSDPLSALAHLSVVFSKHPDAAGWRRFALDDLDGQLDAYCSQSGAWEESINYALYTFSYFVITFRALKAYAGVDYFNDVRVRRFASWLVRFLGPVDKRWNKYTWPGIGNAVCPSGGGEYLLCFAGQLAEGDPLRADLLAAWKCVEPNTQLSEHYPTVMAAMAPLAVHAGPLRALESEWMHELGVALRDRHTRPQESYLFQKIGFTKDHYEADESSFNWYAKGTPLCMDYGTYTSDVGVAGAHNLVEIPDEDALRRGYLKSHLFTPSLDYTHCQLPVTLKLLWGKVRSFEEVENKDGKIDRTKTPYFYIGDKNPVGPKTWKVRLLMFVKPDYLVIFDRVYGHVPHRYNLHVTGTDIQRNGPLITAKGRFDLDLLAYVHHPAEFDMETGELVPNVSPPDKPNEKLNHAQHFFRLYNRQDGIYRTVLFAKERGREVHIESLGSNGVRVITPEYTDHVFLHDQEMVTPGFVGRAGWIRRTAAGTIQACVPDGDFIEGFGTRLKGRGPWSYDTASVEAVKIHGSTPIRLNVQRTGQGNDKHE